MNDNNSKMCRFNHLLKCHKYACGHCRNLACKENKTRQNPNCPDVQMLKKMGGA